MSTRPARWAVVALVAAALLPSPARAGTIDLTTYGSSGSSQGALFYQANPQPTGTGYIDPFVRIQRTGTERGYNTDARPVEFDTKDANQWTHALPLNSMTQVTLNGTAYYQFLLDINESANDANRLLSMNDFRLYLGDSGSLTNWSDGFGGHSKKVYDIDAAGDVTVQLDYKLNSGSGSGDMYAYVPVSLFQGYASKYQYVYLYSAFGDPYGSNAGFEEWAALTSKPPVVTPPKGVPAPPGLVLAGVGMGCLFVSRLRRKTTTKQE